MPEERGDEMERLDAREQRRKRKKRMETAAKIWRAVRPVLIVALSVLVCVFVLKAGVGYVLENYIEPVDPNDATPVTVTIKSGSGASAIAKLLYEACGDGESGLISSKAVFKVYVDFTGKSSKLRAGTYVLSKNMDIEEIVDIICAGNPAKKTVRFTVTEGTDIPDMAKKLVEAGIIQNEKEFLEICEKGEAFTDYSFVRSITENTENDARFYMLEGYLFPDTYEVYADASAKTVINRMLMRFQEIFTDAYIERADELGLTIDEVVTLASLVEKEAVTADFKKVAAVLFNRMDEDMPLEVDAPLRYILRLNTTEFTAEQVNTDSPYNTRVYKGIPLGPITNPGRNAIEAVLYPDEDYRSEGYLYFVLKAKDSTELVFAKTYEEHQENVEKYRGIAD